MYTAPFSYKKASNLSEALSLLQQNPEAKLLAGGHSLIPAMKLRLAAPPLLIDISKVAELRGIRREGDTLVIGAMTTYRELETSDLLKELCPIIPQAVSLIGDPMVRTKGTIGGSLAHADPAADLPASMLALEARIKIQGPSGSRVVEAEQFFTGMFSTALGEGEILTEVHIPVRPGARMAYAKFPHPASRYAVVGVAVVLDGNSVRAAVTGAGEHAMRLTKLEQALSGQALSAESITAACQGLLPADNLNHDLAASKEYRAHLVDVMAKRALLQAAGL
ncbi:FAD binding domain-containing protein [Meiothermus taiwanensis]|jgi:carbon-monoxide dehydrogenase medium subunit|uniref:Carbon monoxide dehydrogenase medium chain n=1 Tax=Meiothermus taiwanensis TaxID=172827 RepID=A0A399E1L6_9DEIN|nr:xanthine dehydrogenase family protein subunit M [Meiothermus taiwanensis]KIQ54836.1 carbon monoxide dehydrogenase [Meiothermus taiwanensis]KZK16033.1 carbon monoxide dehydrogenase [Meiothermus taiwanensis]RIH78395.1 Carbon monoxide dehydrogenase medium chain [Meiothermus taiwanensis]